MIKHFISLSFILLVNSKSMAVSRVDEVCANKHKFKSSDCYTENPSLPIELNQSSFKLLTKWTWISTRVAAKKKVLEAELDEHKNMFRFLRDGKVYDDSSKPWHENEFKNISNDFEDLRKITEHIEILNNKLNLCYKLCSAYTRVKTEDAIKNAQLVKMGLLAKRPILAGPKIEKLLLDNFEKEISEEAFKKSLQKTYTDYFSGIKEEIGKIDKFLKPVDSQYEFLKTSRPKSEKIRQDEYFNKIDQAQEEKDYFINDFLAELDWNSEIESSAYRPVVCEYYSQLKSHQRIKGIKDTSLDVAMLVGPMMAGPLFRVGAWGLRATNLAKWGVKEHAMSKVLRATTSGVSAGYFAKSLVDLKDKKDICNKKLSKFYREGSRYDYYDFKRCASDYQRDSLLTVVEASFTSVDASIKLVKSLRFLKQFDKTNKIFNARDLDELKHTVSKGPINGNTVDDVGFKLSTSDRGDFFVFNVNESNASKKYGNVSEDYWNYVARIYNDRLKLSPEEIKSFIKSSNEMASRTTLVLNTEKRSLKNVNGGVALVTSSKSVDKMPFEKATGISIPREKGKRVAEVVRLTVGKKDPELMKGLLDILLKTVEGEKNIDKLYVYTSKIHGRLYKRLGFPMKEVSRTKRDVVYEIDMDDVINGQ
ncbi:MAG: hypothetical protein BM556_01900 [Bacteriovorax sp. MedPE-SWde]|nr:MAG: hypothetical protein BM556_01900 [Bacteriovorax sp. MedPE-SWde]